MRGAAVVVAIQEERLTRRKNERLWGSLPSLSVAYCLSHAGVKLTDISGVGACVQGRSDDLVHDLRLNPQFRGLRDTTQIIHVSHHRAHALSMGALSGSLRSALLVMDGMGSPACDLASDERPPSWGADYWETASLYEEEGASLRTIAKFGVANARWLCAGPGAMKRFRSAGGMYSALADYIFGDELEAGKVMGLSSYGSATIPVESFVRFEGGEVMFSDEIPARFAERRSLDRHFSELANLAASGQRALEAVVLDACARLRIASDAEDLGFAGGVALNSVANERILREGGFHHCFFMPAADDAGTAIGAALGAHLSVTGRNGERKRARTDNFGAAYTETSIERAMTAGFLEARKATPSDVAVALAAGKVVAIFDGGSEFGPRSLGHRSILADPRESAARDRINERVKHRETFRPFAPAVLEEYASEWFEFGHWEQCSPFMLRVVPARPLAAQKAPAIVHVDGTSRLQTVGAEHPLLHAILRDFQALTGLPMLLNTSFNVMGEPIVESPEDAVNAMMETDIDLLYAGGILGSRIAMIRSNLDLSLVRQLKSFEMRFDFEKAGTTRSKLSFDAVTPYGTVRHSATANVSRLLQLADGTRNGWQIRDELAGMGHDIDSEGFSRTVSLLRRLGAIRYMAPSCSAVIGRNATPSENSCSPIRK